MRSAVVLIILLAAASAAGGQTRDDFSDGTFLAHPAWSGDVNRWQVGILGGSPALQSNGAAGADTIHLALATGTSMGRWDFVFAHEGVNLSTFNGVRLFLSSNGADPDSGVAGYYLQAGTNNADLLSLWRIDGSWDRRVELARSADVWVSGDSSFLRISVERDVSSRWSVRANGRLVMEAQDGRYTDGKHFVVWVKHSAAGAAGFFLDELIVSENQAPAYPPPRAFDVVINEVYFDPPPEGAEFVELYNRSAASVDLGQLVLRDSRAPPFTLSDSLAVLAPGEYAVVVSDADAFRRQFRRVPFHAPAGWASLNNSGDAVVLKAGSVVVDSVAYGPDAVRPGFSLERIDPDGPSDAYNFTSASNAFGATPGERNSAYAPDASGPRVVFVEQIGDSTIAVVFDEPLSDAGLRADDVRQGTTPGAAIESASPSRYLVHFPNVVTEETVDIVSAADRRGNTSSSLSAPIAYLPQAGDLVVNEIMYEPRTDRYDGISDHVEYVELANRSSRLLTLVGLYRTRDPDERGDADTLAVGRSSTSIAAAGFYVIASDTSNSAAIPTVSAQAALGLRNDGDRIRLHGPRGVVLDDVAYDPSWHHPDLLERRGISLERIDLYGSGDEPENWTSSIDPSGGTPGTLNSVALRSRPRAEAVGVSIAPNPFSPDRDGNEDTAVVSFRLRKEVSLVRVRIFDLDGHLVRELVPADMVGREGVVYWDGLDDLGRRLRVGVYIVVVEAAGGERRTTDVHKAAVVLAKRL